MATSPKTNGVTLVTTENERKQFIQFPYDHYKDDKYWVAPLKMEQKKLIDREKNPFMKTGTSLFSWPSKTGRSAVV